MTRYSIKSIPLAAAMAAALVFGGQVHAQSTNTVTPPGSMNKKDMAVPAPGNSTMPAKAGADGGNSSLPAGSAQMTPGTTKSKDAVEPAPMGGMAKSADDRTMAKSDKAQAKAAKRAARKSKMTTAPTTDSSSAPATPVTKGDGSGKS